MPLSRVRLAVLPLALLYTLLVFAPTAVAGPAGDPLVADQWGLAAIAAPDAWDAITADDVVIAVVDSGVAVAHPDLAPVLQPGIDLVDGDDQPDDPNGHGTHVAGIAAATVGNGIGIAGVAAGARILPVRVLDADGNGDPATIAEGILWAADHGADVINLSLATAGVGDRLFKGGPINAAIRTAAAAGVTVVAAAAGNDDEFARAYRARVPVLVVNATDPSGAPAEFTAFGDPRAVAAPGVDILSTAPTGPTTLWPDGTDGYARLDGTSMAAPHAAGVAALLAAAGVTGPAAIDQILATATPGDDPRLGAGLVDAAAAVDLPATGTATPAPSATPDDADDAPAPTATAPETVTPTAGGDATTAVAPIRTARRGRWLIGLAVLALVTLAVVIAVRR